MFLAVKVWVTAAIENAGKTKCDVNDGTDFDDLVKAMAPNFGYQFVGLVQVYRSLDDAKQNRNPLDSAAKVLSVKQGDPFVLGWLFIFSS